MGTITVISMDITVRVTDQNNRLDRTLDFHAHILPGCDHGSDGLETSLRQIALAREAGIKTLCATPHFYPSRESVSSFLCRREETYALLRKHLSECDPHIELGAEVLICDGIERLDGLRGLCREGTGELLLEMPFYTWQEYLWDTIYALADVPDISLVIAHADRYPIENIERLIRNDINVQLNADCFRRTLKRKRYMDWIRRGAVKYLGSDIHGTEPGYRDWNYCWKLLDKSFSKQKG